MGVVEQAVEQRGDGGGVRQLAHAEIVDDQERLCREVSEKRLSSLVECRVGDLVDERVRLSMDDAIALLDRRTSESVGEMTLAGARRPAR